ncbi:MAG: winged helix-turn-helix domain-containing protein [Elusimicrobiota bacterium]
MKNSDMQEIVGKAAGDIWQYLKENGPSTALKIKSALGISNSILHLGLGWLSREGKVEIAESGHTLNISLKSDA